MRRWWVASAAVSAAMLLAGSDGAAQSSGTCTVNPATVSGADACQKANDLFRFIVPQVGVAVAGGNPILGDAGSLGGLGRRAISLRVIAVDGRLPRNSVPISIVGGSQPSDFGAARTIVPMPALDLAVGLFPGVPMGLTNVGGVDALVGVTYLPSASRSEFALEPRGGGFGLAYGLRVGLLQESSIVPGLGASWQRRELPSTDLRYTPGNDTLNVTGNSVSVDALRIVIAKRLTLFGLAAGVGQDRIDARSNMSAVVNETVLGTPQRGSAQLLGLHEKTVRKTAFVNASFSFVAFRIVGEYGWSSAGSVRETVNSFGGRSANEGYRYGSLGITARF